MKITNLPNEIILNIIGWILINCDDVNYCLRDILFLGTSCKKFLYLLDYNYMIDSETEYNNCITTYCLKYKKSNFDIKFRENGPSYSIDSCYDLCDSMKYYINIFGMCISSYIYYENGHYHFY